mmetsp:Transcript_92180/g.298457  ORF Transcript_92180/g.298457 Transcript_92180/m.298457 type:complete len:250 (+) Transcript_92180:532-1281(+)
MDRCCQVGWVVAAEDDLAAMGAQGEAEVGQQLVGTVHQALVEAHERAGREALQGQAQDAVVWHGTEGRVVHADGRQHGEAGAGVAPARLGAQADVIAHQHAFRRAFPEVSLGEADGHDRAVHGAPGQTGPLLHSLALRVHIHGRAGLPRRVAPVLHAGRALARPMGQQEMPRGSVEQHPQLLPRLADRDVAHVEGVPGVPRATPDGPRVNPLQAHRERPRQPRGRWRCRGLRAQRLAPQCCAKVGPGLP